MWVKHGLNHLTLANPTGLTIGSFDGVHRGHQALIHQLIEHAHTLDLEAVVLTFDPLPRQLFGGKPQQLLSSLDERLQYLASLKPDGVIVIPFDQKFASQSAETFAGRLINQLNMKILWIGPDFTLGRDRAGNAARLEELGRERGFEVHTVPPFLLDGNPVHSSRIRKLLLTGDLKTANQLLGRPYALSGTVVHGEKRGHTLGFPTANLEVPEERLVPAKGIYVCRVHLPPQHIETLETQSFGAVTNIGTRPTFNHSETTIEAHILDFSKDIYDAPMRLEFLARLREEKRFDSAAALIAQMQEDKARAKAWLNGHS